MGSGYTTVPVPKGVKALMDDVRCEYYSEFLPRLLIAADPETIREARADTVEMTDDEMMLKAALVHGSVAPLQEHADEFEFPDGLDNLRLDVDQYDDDLVEEARELIDDVQSRCESASSEKEAVTDGGEQ